MQGTPSLRRNRFRSLLKSQRVLCGLAIYSGSPALVEVAGLSGFDFIFIESEHSPFTTDEHLAHMVRAADVAGAPVMLRLKGNDEHMIRNALECGVEAVCVPHIRTRDDAERAVRAAKFPPRGIRGASAEIRAARYGTAPFDWAEYIREANDDTVVVGLAEDPEFFDNIDGILSVDGFDVASFGPADLALSMGIAKLYQAYIPEVRERFLQLKEAARRHGIVVMAPAAPPTAEEARKLADDDVRIIMLRNDISHFRSLCRQLVDDIVIPLKSSV